MIEQKKDHENFSHGSKCFLLMKTKAGGHLHLLPLSRGGGYLFRPQLFSLLSRFYLYYPMNTRELQDKNINDNFVFSLRECFS